MLGTQRIQTKKKTYDFYNPDSRTGFQGLNYIQTKIRICLYLINNDHQSYIIILKDDFFFFLTIDNVLCGI